MNCWPKAAESFSAAMRPSVSAVPPAVNGMSTRTGRVGHSSLRAAGASITKLNASNSVALAAAFRDAGLRDILLPVIGCPTRGSRTVLNDQQPSTVQRSMNRKILPIFHAT
jgi:hypothetical protein